MRAAASRANFSHSASMVGSRNCLRLAFNNIALASLMIIVSWEGMGQQLIEPGQIGKRDRDIRGRVRQVE